MGIRILTPLKSKNLRSITTSFSLLIEAVQCGTQLVLSEMRLLSLSIVLKREAISTYAATEVKIQ